MMLSAAIFAGLGRDCQVSYRLRTSPFNALPMPFDYMSTPCVSLHELLATRLDGLTSRNAWRVSDRTLVHRELPVRIGHLRADGEVGAALALARVHLTTAVLRCCRRLPLPIVFVRLAESARELSRSEELFELVRRHAPTARLVHVVASDADSGWREAASGIAHATIHHGTTWRGDRSSWRRLLARAHAWALAGRSRVAKPLVAQDDTLASKLLGADWQRLLVVVAQLQHVSNKPLVDPMVHAALVQAEDRRFFWHSGIDWLRTTRATVEWTLGRQAGGGSTIEQQFVRVATGHYQRTVRRKIREMVAATALQRILSKQEILSGYLSLAYFGSGMTGIDHASRKLGIDTTAATPETAAQLVSHLRFPWSPTESERWQARRKERTRWITSRIT